MTREDQEQWFYVGLGGSISLLSFQTGSIWSPWFGDGSYSQNSSLGIVSNTDKMRHPFCMSWLISHKEKKTTSLEAHKDHDRTRLAFSYFEVDIILIIQSLFFWIVIQIFCPLISLNLFAYWWHFLTKARFLLMSYHLCSLTDTQVWYKQILLTDGVTVCS